MFVKKTPNNQPSTTTKPCSEFRVFSCIFLDSISGVDLQLLQSRLPWASQGYSVAEGLAPGLYKTYIHSNRYALAGCLECPTLTPAGISFLVPPISLSQFSLPTSYWCSATHPEKASTAGRVWRMPRSARMAFLAISSAGLSISKTTSTWLHRTQQFCISLISFTDIHTNTADADQQLLSECQAWESWAVWKLNNYLFPLHLSLTNVIVGSLQLWVSYHHFSKVPECLSSVSSMPWKCFLISSGQTWPKLFRPGQQSILFACRLCWKFVTTGLEMAVVTLKWTQTSEKTWSTCGSSLVFGSSAHKRLRLCFFRILPKICCQMWGLSFWGYKESQFLLVSAGTKKIQHTLHLKCLFGC